MTRKLVLALLVLSVCALSAGIALAAGGGSDAEAKPVAAAKKDPPCIKPEKGGGCLPVAPESARVDLGTPAFSDPTDVTNPLHPTGKVASVLMLGKVDGLPFRSEVTLLPETKTITWNGQQVETLVSQYAAFLDGRLHEVALDWYAQADDGAVWYFGEDVFNYEDGVVADTHGTWLAGVDGPPGMIMPGNPQVGDVYRPENIPGLVFEEVTVEDVNETVHGPSGSVPGAVVVEELHMDATTEGKIFAPGYGEFLTGGGGDLEAVALAVPTDAPGGPPPADLVTLTTGAREIFDAAGNPDWTAATATLDAMIAAWESYQEEDLPRMLDARMSDAMVFLVAAVDSRAPAETRQAAVDATIAALDLELQHRPVAEIDLARFGLWASQVLVDVEADDSAAVSGDVATLEWTWDRVAHTVGDPTAGEIEDLLVELRAAADAEDLSAAKDAAADLRDVVAGI